MGGWEVGGGGGKAKEEEEEEEERGEWWVWVRSLLDRLRRWWRDQERHLNGWVGGWVGG